METDDKKKFSLFQLAWPIFVNSILGMLLGFIDIFVLSKVNDLAASAISAACQITSVCSLIFSAVCSAAGIMVAQHLGRGDKEKVSKISALCITINVLFGIVITMIVVVGHNSFLEMLGAKSELYDMASQYIGILAWGIVLDAYVGAVGTILYSHGETKIAMFFSLSMGILNLLLDIILVLGYFGFPQMGVKGAAIATMITKVVYTVLLSVIFFRNMESVFIFRKLADVRYKETLQIFKLGIPSIFDSVNYTLSQLVVTGIIFHYLSQNAIIARTYLVNIAAFFTLITGALATATQIMVGHEIGAGEYEKAEEDCARCIKLSLVATGGGCLLALLLSNHLFGIFTGNEAVIRIGFRLMAANIFVELGRAANVVYVWCLRGAGDVGFPVFVAACCMWIIAVGGSFAAVSLFGAGIVGVWVIAGVDECVRAVIMAGRWKSGKWKEKKL